MKIPPSAPGWIAKRGVLLLLLAGYMLTTSIVIEQQRTIESQRVLIRDLFRDSMELNSLRMKDDARR